MNREKKQIFNAQTTHLGCFCPIIVVLKNNIIPFVEVEIAYNAFYIIQLKIQNYFNGIDHFL